MKKHMSFKGCVTAVKNNYKKRKNFELTELFKTFSQTGSVDYYPMIAELKYRTHLPKWICEKVYDAEASILTDLGLLK